MTRRTYSATAGKADQWVTLATRSVSGAIDAWEEYLAARQHRDGILIDIFAHRWLGEVPNDWYDKEGLLLPMGCTEDGDVRLPEVFNGSPVFGYLDGRFIGSLKRVHDGARLELRPITANLVREALDHLGWGTEDAPIVLMTLEAMLRR